MVKLRERDKNTLEKLAYTIKKFKGETSNSEVVGLSLRFARSNMDEFLETILKDLQEEPLVKILRKPAGMRRGERTDARRIEEYLYES